MDNLNNSDVSMGDLPETSVSVDEGLESGNTVFFTAYENVTEHNVDVNDEVGGDVDMDGNAEPEHPEIVEVKALHRDAEEKLATKTYKVNRSITLLPSLHSIYFHPNEAVVPQAPLDLQLASFFILYNDIAMANFLADKSLPPMVNRAIFFYGLDKGHSFSRFFDQIRFNILLMAFAWASNFNPKYCKEGYEEFVKYFLRAWIESLVFKYDPSQNNFTQREAFIALWQASPFDFHFFSARRSKTVNKLVNILKAQAAFLPNIPKPDDFMRAVRKGQLNEGIFEKFGAAMTLQWLIGLNEKYEKRQQKIDDKEEVVQTNLDLRRTKIAAGNLAAAHHFGYFSKDYQMADDFDPFDEEDLMHPGMSKVDRNEELLAALLLPIDRNLKHPSEVKEKEHRVVDETSFWASHEQVQAILQEDVEKQDSSRALAELTVLMNTTVMEPTAE
ncbi:hypothetical protein BKA58DRAFT_469763 [Alternaria rosae]|uniref:uncharacterized protein n=1 Tax=Alternaria rosae TaxID=1187941 RepID=UPI001E8DBB2F|nr:uncharacterized protein BKA58DRAFT_469763 [Alternaria rosae]KAH6870780.1 hypothetical protein BKA58DRAFT_469763 [Alternaria rosae]